MHSMTGFGEATVMVAGRRLILEIRSVNHRGVEVKLRGRELDAACEVAIGQAVRAAVARGAVAVSIHEEVAAGGPVDADRVRAVHAALETLRDELRLEGAVDLRTVAAFMAHGAAFAARGAAFATVAPVCWDDLRSGVAQALRGLGEMRAREGAVLAADLGRRLHKLGEIIAHIARAVPSLPVKAGRKMEERIAALSAHGPLDPARLAQEVALLADRLDVSEELVRLDAHMSLMTGLVAPRAVIPTPTPVGRKMDFVIQEIARELNTVGSKVQDAEVATWVIDAKAELEKLREQAQNVE